MSQNERLLELLAARQLGDLDGAEQLELEELMAKTDDIPDMDRLLGDLLVAIDDASDDAQAGMPDAVFEGLEARGRRIVGGDGPSRAPANVRRSPMLAIAAALAIVGLSVALVYVSMQATQHRQNADDKAAVIAQLEERIETNQAIIQQAQVELEDLRDQIANSQDTIDEQTLQLNDARSRQLELVEQLAAATSDIDTITTDLESARRRITQYENPFPPEVLALQRQQLLDRPNTVVQPWSPFEVAGAPPPVQPGVTGDVVWNHDEKTGYLRFVGLEVNDPTEFVYQVWIIDERGMEQKVSGGIFSATARGEVIVPIQPGIDVGRVGVFAVTLEDPGGTWVPDLRRRLVVAPLEG